MPDNTNIMKLLRAEKTKVTRLIKQIEQKLAKIEQGEIARNQPYITTQPGLNIASLAGNGLNYEQVLKRDLKILRLQIEEISRDLQDVRKEHSGKLLPLAQPLPHSRQELLGQLDHLLSGTNLSPESLQQGRAISEQLLQGSVEAMTKNPSENTMKTVLNDLANTQLLGGDRNTGAARKAFEQLTQTAEHLHTQAETRFRESCTVADYRKMLKQRALAQFVGGWGQLQKQDWKNVGNKRKTTRPGDTLSGISKEYYGSFKFWDIIYEANMEKIGMNPNSLKSGLILVIP